MIAAEGARGGWFFQLGWVYNARVTSPRSYPLSLKPQTRTSPSFTAAAVSACTNGPASPQLKLGAPHITTHCGPRPSFLNPPMVEGWCPTHVCTSTSSAVQALMAAQRGEHLGHTKPAVHVDAVQASTLQPPQAAGQSNREEMSVDDFYAHGNLC